MTSTEQLKQLLKNAFYEGFTAEDIKNLAKDIELEQEAEAECEEYIDDLQYEAATTLANFLFEIDYFDDSADYDEQVDAISEALQLVRDGKLKVSVKNSDKGCSCSTSYSSGDIEAFRKILSKYL